MIFRISATGENVRPIGHAGGDAFGRRTFDLPINLAGIWVEACHEIAAAENQLVFAIQVHD